MDFKKKKSEAINQSLGHQAARPGDAYTLSFQNGSHQMQTSGNQQSPYESRGLLSDRRVSAFGP
jgi:hypothetical protein